MTPSQPIIGGKKRCTKCDKIKVIEEFGVNRKNTNGLLAICHKCYNKKISDWKRSHPEKTEKDNDKWNSSQAARISKIKYLENNPERRREASRKYYASNKEMYAENRKRWASKNKGRLVCLRNERRAKMLAGGKWNVSDWKKLVNHYCPSGRCLRCKKSVGKNKLTVDHVIPINIYGPNLIWNLQPLCRSCNCSRPKKSIEDYRPDLGEYARSLFNQIDTVTVA